MTGLRNRWTELQRVADAIPPPDRDWSLEPMCAERWLCIGDTSEDRDIAFPPATHCARDRTDLRFTMRRNILTLR
jgi:hypothetical protein